MFEIAERKLVAFMKLRYGFFICMLRMFFCYFLHEFYFRYEMRSTDLARRQKRWNEFVQELQTHTT